MTSLLVQAALQNVWCAPNRDLQSIVQPARLTPNGGAWGIAQVQWSSIDLPDSTSTFHVYQVGQLNPRLLGLFPAVTGWTLLSDVCNAQKMFADVYDDNGVQMPRTQIWFIVTYEKNLIFAVKKQPTINTNFDGLFYFRFMTNDFFQTTPALNQGEITHVEGGIMGSTSQILSLQTSFSNYTANVGTVYAFVNGYRVDAINLINVGIGDVAEFVYDASVYKTITFPISALQSFTSTLDSMFKYLLHYSGNINQIDFMDDIDFYVLTPLSSNRYKGVYYHKNDVEAVRMVTHKDYALSVPFVTAYLNEQNYTLAGGAFIQMNVRQTGIVRPFVFENNRIDELYKLPDAEIVGAMIGINSTVPNWTAAVLEASAYTAIMSANYNSVTLQQAENCFGYNAMSVILGDTPTLSVQFSGHQTVQMSPALINNSTAYEYDGNGNLLGYYTAVGQGGLYIATNNTANLVEVISGIATTALDEVYGTQQQTLLTTCDYRMYVCPIVDGTPSYVWQDVTGSGQYGAVNQELSWFVDPTAYLTMVRSNAKFLGYTLEIEPVQGTIELTLMSQQTRGGTTASYAMTVPMGELDIFLNGKSLVENLDYIVDFPKVVIFNKKYLVNPTTQNQRIDIRHTGFCKNDLTRATPRDVGFVKWGRLSDNDRFDIRDDKVLRITVDGCLHAREELQYQEDDPAVVFPTSVNGLPYLIRDIVVPMRGFSVTDTYTLRAASQVIDTNVSNYLTLFAPETDPTTPSAMLALYPVFSPFLCKIIYDLVAGNLTSPLLEEMYSDQDVANIVEPYLYLLPFDPTQVGHQPDPNFVIIHPHNLTTVITVNAYQYKFIQRCVNLYMNGLVNISNFINLST